MNKVLIFLLPLMIGCASTKPTTPTVFKNPQIIVSENKVEFITSKPAEMSYKKGDSEYRYNSQTPSLIQRIISATTLGVVGSRR